MDTFQETLRIKTEEKIEVLDITGMVEEIIESSGIKEGLVLVFPRHTSSAVYVSDSDPGLTLDFIEVLDGMVPDRAGYRHDETDHKKNAAAHIKAVLAGHHVTLPLGGGGLTLGAFQRVYYAEFDGGRQKDVLVKVMGG